MILDAQMEVINNGIQKSQSDLNYIDKNVKHLRDYWYREILSYEDKENAEEMFESWMATTPDERLRDIIEGETNA